VSRSAAWAVLGLLAVACSSAGGAIPEPVGGTVEVPPVEAIGFHDRIETFYRRLVQRRLNALDTFNDPVLRDFFRTPDLFFDYYADLAQALSAAHFEKSRAVDYEIQEFLFEDPERARVQVRFWGGDGRPLRPGQVILIRRDRWERSEGSWWITPGKL
jgi:hypothetical protein